MSLHLSVVAPHCHGQQIVVVADTEKSKPRGYALIEYEHERDMHGMLAV